jgi:hypothetical protein
MHSIQRFRPDEPFERLDRQSELSEREGTVFVRSAAPAGVETLPPSPVDLAAER